MSKPIILNPEDYIPKEIDSDHEHCKILYNTLIDQIHVDNYVMLAEEPHTWIDSLCKKTGLTSSELCSALTALENSKKIKCWNERQNLTYITLYKINKKEFDINIKPPLSRYNIMEQLELF